MTNRAPVRSSRVLVIDDDVETARAFVVALRLQGHLASEAFDGDTGVEEAWRLLPSVVFCDLRLPGEMDGYAVARSLRADRRTARAYLVAVSGRLTPSEERRAREAGFDDYLCKPISGKDLLASIERAPMQETTTGRASRNGRRSADGTKNPPRPLR